jgi:hypothetical protein
MLCRAAVPALVLILAACGQSEEASLENAAAQSDPAAAAVLNAAAENGMDPQQALEQAGQAAAANGAAGAGGPPSGSVQARPNLPGSPNRKDGTQPPDKMVVGQNKTGIAGEEDPKPAPQ